MLLERLLTEDILALFIPLAAISVGLVAILVGAVVSVVDKIHRHRERLAMIEQGMDPDAPKGQRALGRMSSASERIG
jgi:hypothetical protein